MLSHTIKKFLKLEDGIKFVLIPIFLCQLKPNLSHFKFSIHFLRQHCIHALPCTAVQSATFPAEAQQLYHNRRSGDRTVPSNPHAGGGAHLTSCFLCDTRDTERKTTSASDTLRAFSQILQFLFLAARRPSLSLASSCAEWFTRTGSKQITDKQTPRSLVSRSKPECLEKP